MASDEVKKKMGRAKALIQAGEYEKAAEILRTVDHPKADEWLEKLEPRLKRKRRSAEDYLDHKRVKGLKFRARLWGALAVLVMLYMCWGLIDTSVRVDRVNSTPVPTNEVFDQETMEGLRDAAVGTGATINLALIFCTGFLPFLVFALLAWRNGAGLRTEQRHAEQLAATSR